MTDEPSAEIVEFPRAGSRAERHAALRRLGEEWWEPPAELIDTLPKGGVQLRYLSHIWVRKALQDADPDWYWEPMGYDSDGQPVIERDSQGNPVGFWIWLHLLGTKMPGYGSVEPGKRDAVKELIGDALRNASMRLVGGALWVKDNAKKKPPAKKKEPLPAAAEPVDDAPHHEKEAGKEAYDAMVAEHGEEIVNGALATFNIAKFSELTPPKVKAIQASLAQRARIMREQAEREEADG